MIQNHQQTLPHHFRHSWSGKLLYTSRQIRPHDSYSNLSEAMKTLAIWVNLTQKHSETWKHCILDTTNIYKKDFCCRFLTNFCSKDQDNPVSSTLETIEIRDNSQCKSVQIHWHWWYCMKLHCQQVWLEEYKGEKNKTEEYPYCFLVGVY